VRVANIICTGYSLKGFDLNSIEGYKIAVNYAHRYLDHYDALVAWDNVEMPLEKLHTLKEYGKDCTGYIPGIVGEFDRNEGYTTNFASSLFFAINIALQKGFDHVKIYGCDMQLTDGMVHFYDDKPPQDNIKEIYRKRFIQDRKYLDRVLSSLKENEKIEFITV